MGTVNNLVGHVRSSIRRRGLIRRGSRAVVAVSGGLDSMVLLHVLHGLAAENSWQLTVAHLNHRLRGRSSLADERLVVRTARKWGLRVVTQRADVRAFARAQKISLEMAARTLRHNFLARTARAAGAPVIALAHHADDQVELFFLRLFRGSGGEGLAGMDWRGPSPADRRKMLARPFLDVPKSELRAYAGENNIPFREDATNASLDVRRNRIRHELLPLLRRHYQPALERTVLRVMNILGAEAEFADLAARQFQRTKASGPGLNPGTPHPAFGLPLPVRWGGDRAGAVQTFRTLPVAVQRRVIQRQLLRAKIAADFELIEELRTVPGHTVMVTGGRIVSLDSEGGLRLGKSKRPGESSSRRVEFALNPAFGATQFNGARINWRVFARRGNRLPRIVAGREFFDATKVGGRVVLRHWKPGDRFQPIGMRVAAKLQDIFVNQKIPRERRHEIVVAEAANGEIFWVEQLRISERFKLSNNSSHRLEWRWKHL